MRSSRSTCKICINNSQIRPLGGLGSRRTEKLGSLVNPVLIGFAAV